MRDQLDAAGRVYALQVLAVAVPAPSATLHGAMNRMREHGPRVTAARYLLYCPCACQDDKKVLLLLGAAGGAMFGEATLGFYASKNMVKKVSFVSPAVVLDNQGLHEQRCDVNSG